MEKIAFHDDKMFYLFTCYFHLQAYTFWTY